MAIFLLSFALVCALLAPPDTEAQVVVYDAKANFLADTGSTSATGPLPGVFAQLVVVAGSVTFQPANGISPLRIQDYSARLPGNDLGMDGVENLDVFLDLPQAVYSIGFDFVEPEHDPNVNAPFVDSEFTVTLLDGQQAVGSFSFSRPNDTASFVGAWGNLPFDRLEIREIVGDIENEFWGEFYAGHTPLSTVAVNVATMGEVKAKFK